MRGDVHHGEEEFCTNSRCWMFKRAFVPPRACPYAEEKSCVENCLYLEVRKMPKNIREQFDRMYGGKR